MLKMIDKKDYKHRTWTEIVKDFPDAFLVIKDHEMSGSTCLGGIVVAYTVPDGAPSRGEACMFAKKNGYFYTNTKDMGGVFFTW